MNTKTLYFILAVVIILAIVLIFFKDKLLGTKEERQISGEGVGSPEQDTFTPIDISGTGGTGGTGGTASTAYVTDIKARFQTGLPIKGSLWRDITPEVKAYTNSKGGSFEIKPVIQSWINQFGLPLTWGIPNPLYANLSVIQSPSAKLEIEFKTNQTPNWTNRNFSASQKVTIP
jgi:hypothetical protein